MSRSSQRHGREVHGMDSANQVNVAGKGGGYGGGGVAPATFPVFPPAALAMAAPPAPKAKAKKKAKPKVEMDGDCDDHHED